MVARDASPERGRERERERGGEERRNLGNSPGCSKPGSPDRSKGPRRYTLVLQRCLGPRLLPPVTPSFPSCRLASFTYFSTTYGCRPHGLRCFSGNAIVYLPCDIRGETSILRAKRKNDSNRTTRAVSSLGGEVARREAKCRCTSRPCYPKVSAVVPSLCLLQAAHGLRRRVDLPRGMKASSGLRTGRISRATLRSGLHVLPRK